MKTFSIVCIFVILLVSFLYPGVRNPDKPLKGEWDFEQKQLWMIDEVGGDVFAKPYSLLTADNGTVYLYDVKNLKYFILSKEGKFVKSFGPKGEGPGEIQRFRSAYLVNDKLIVVDLNEIDYFTTDGKYIKSVKNEWNQKKPNYFLNEDEFIHFPLLRANDPKLKGKIYRHNLKTNDSKVLAEFPIFKGGFAEDNESRVGVVIMGLSPVIVAGYDSDRLYYGINNSFEINVVDYNGKKSDSFSVERETRKLSKKAKREWFAKNPAPGPMPDGLLKKIIKSLPDELTHFTRIEVYNKLIYIFTAYLNRQPTKQQIDIFTRDGKYQYRAFINTPEGYNIVSGPIPVLTLKNDNLYIALEDEDGEVALARYEITLPR